ncbi:MAG: hypothetical protein D3926_01490 [Desulfobacteraceae bacterium]|nr:MAG: hypothetical protein D3926_01490 [Desulfobacteraceae bacterium]
MNNDNLIQPTELLRNISEFIRSMDNLLKKYNSSAEELQKSEAEMLENINTFVGHSGSMLFNDPKRFTDGTKKPEYKIGPSGRTKSDVAILIDTMRENGATFKAIADHLTDENIPTFSGRGEWHAQTVQRLFEKKN